MKRNRFVLLASLVAVLGVSQAQAAISLAPITTGIADLDTAALAAAATVIGVAVGWFALKFGGKWILKVFKSMTS